MRVATDESLGGGFDASAEHLSDVLERLEKTVDDARQRRREMRQKIEETNAIMTAAVTRLTDLIHEQEAEGLQSIVQSAIRTARCITPMKTVRFRMKA